MIEGRKQRVFFALWPDDETTAHLSALAQELTARGGGRVMHPSVLHVTLAFVGSITAAQVATLEQLAAGIHAKAFDLSLDRLGFWPQQGILWVGCRQAPPALRTLAEPLIERLGAAGFAIDRRPGAGYLPHITLARRARCAALPRLAAPLRWRVADFSLVESRLDSGAARYTTLASFPLDEEDAG